jgi:hypothetical protein
MRVRDIALLTAATIICQFSISTAAIADCPDTVALDEEPVTVDSSTLQGKCPITRSNLCFDRLYRVEVTNNCGRKIRLQVSAGRSPSTGEWTLEKGQKKRFGCQEAADGCKGVPQVSLIGSGAEIGQDNSRPKGKPDPNPSTSDSPGEFKTDRDAAARAQQQFEFNHAERLNTKEGWAAFLKSWPEGVLAEVAKKRLKELDGPGESKTQAEGKPQAKGNQSAALPPFPDLDVGRAKWGLTLAASLQNSGSGERHEWRRGKGWYHEAGPISGTGSLRWDVKYDGNVLTITEIDDKGQAKFPCGLNKEISSIGMRLPNLEMHFSCSYSREGNTWRASYKSQSRRVPKPTKGHHGLINGELRFIASDTGCKLLDAKQHFDMLVPGLLPNAPWWKEVRSATLISGTCSLNR